MSAAGETREVTVRVNGREVTLTVPVRESLADALRDRLQLTGTHLGCEQGVCGSCTVFMDGGSVRSCTTLAVQAERSEIWTVEGLSPTEGLSRLQRLLAEEHGLQCGFCTPGILVSATELLASTNEPLSPEQVRVALSGNLCRCTGYDGIIAAVVTASQEAQDLPSGLAVSSTVARTGEVTAIPSAAHGPAAAGGAEPVREPAVAAGEPRWRPPAAELTAALVGVAVGAVLRLRRG